MKKLSSILISSFLFLVFGPQAKAQVVINEFYPKSPEWVEFYNKGTSEVNLSNYFFDDDSNFSQDLGSSTKFSLQGILSPNATCYKEISSFLNDSGDAPTLFLSNGDIEDSYQYASSSSDFSYSRLPDGGDWQYISQTTKSQTSCLSLPTPSPSSTNSPTSTTNPTPAPTTNPTKTPTPIPTKTSIPKPSPTASLGPSPTPSLVSDSQIDTSSTSFVTVENTPQVLGENVTRKNFSVLPVILVSSGVLMIGFAVYNLLSARKNIKTN